MLLHKCFDTNFVWFEESRVDQLHSGLGFIYTYCILKFFKLKLSTYPWAGVVYFPVKSDCFPFIMFESLWQKSNKTHHFVAMQKQWISESNRFPQMKVLIQNKVIANNFMFPWSWNMEEETVNPPLFSSFPIMAVLLSNCLHLPLSKKAAAEGGKSPPKASQVPSGLRIRWQWIREAVPHCSQAVRQLHPSSCWKWS